MEGLRLVIVSQESLAQEFVEDTSSTHCIHSVVKNLPFLVSLGLHIPSSCTTSAEELFHSMPLEAFLVYDHRPRSSPSSRKAKKRQPEAEEEEQEEEEEEEERGFKPVPFLKQKPMEYTGTIDTNYSPAQMVVSVKIIALSSQHGHLPFRVCFHLKDAEESAVITEPIRVLSKPNQIPLLQQQRRKSTATTAPSKGNQPASTTPSPTNKNKRSFNELLTERLESLTLIQQKQQQNIDLLRQIAHARGLPIKPPSSEPTFSASSSSSSSSLFPPSPSLSSLSALPASHWNSISDDSGLFPPLMSFLDESLLTGAAPSSLSESSGSDVHDNAGDALEKAFHALLDAYHNTPVQRRPEKVRRIVRKTSARTLESFSELVGRFASSSPEFVANMKGGGCDDYHGSYSQPVTLCPHADELRRMEELSSCIY